MTKFGRVAIAFSVCLLVVGSGAVLAHHSQASFDTEKEVTIEGVVTQLSLANPHTLVFLNAKVKGADDSTMTRWALEGPSVAGLRQAGWTRETVKVGETLTAMGSPSRSGRPLMLLREVMLADGTHIVTGTD